MKHDADDRPLPRYDWQRTYDWNYAHAPEPLEIEVPPLPGSWQFCGLPVNSPLGVPAGPLLNGRWCLYYASLGFDVLTYKTVRSRARECYPMPNLQPVQCSMLRGGERGLRACPEMHGSWAVSFGMPSRDPDVWRADVERTRRRLAPDKLLSVSVVGTMQPGWTVDELAEDYALCARWAVESGADAVEMNLSCPNVRTCDGQLYQNPADALRVVQQVREAVSKTPLIAKIGHLPEQSLQLDLLRALAPWVNAVAMTNSVAATVQNAAGQPLFDGQPRGICGAATREASLRQVRQMAELARAEQLAVRLIGVGGAETAVHVQQYLAAGAQAVHLATAAMLDPAVALRLRREWLA